MFTSMTGYGRAQVERDWGSLSLELWSVNHRYQEVTVRLPRELASWEPWFHQRLRKGFRRGKVQGKLEILWAASRKAGRVNREVFPEPQALLTPNPKMPGTDGRKMSKSYGNSLNIADEPKELWEKLRPMVTDPARYRRSDPGDPDKCPVWDLHRFFNQDLEERKELEQGCRNAGIGCVDCKKKLFVHVEKMMVPIQERRRAFAAREETLTDILRHGADRARGTAAATMEEVYRAIGFYR